MNTKWLPSQNSSSLLIAEAILLYRYPLANIRAKQELLTRVERDIDDGKAQVTTILFVGTSAEIVAAQELFERVKALHVLAQAEFHYELGGRTANIHLRENVIEQLIPGDKVLARRFLESPLMREAYHVGI